MTGRIFGLLLSFVAGAAWFIEAGSSDLSTVIGQSMCEENYLQPVNGFVNDASCGFNTDMYLSSALIALSIFGMFLFVKPGVSLFHESDELSSEEEQETIQKDFQ